MSISFFGQNKKSFLIAIAFALAATATAGLAGTAKAHDAGLEICKKSDTTFPVTGTYSFTVAAKKDGQDFNQTFNVNVNTCVVTPGLDSGTATITELAKAGSTLVDITVDPSERLNSKNLASRSVNVDLVDFSSTEVTFTNKANQVANGNGSCTPGFWKNHTGTWDGYSSNQTLESVFDIPNTLGKDSQTLLASLQGGGGSGVSGASTILLRAGTAALLNASSNDFDYPRTTSNVISEVNTALASSNRTTILNLAKVLDDEANRFGCPL